MRPHMLATTISHVLIQALLRIDRDNLILIADELTYADDRKGSWSSPSSSSLLQEVTSVSATSNFVLCVSRAPLALTSPF